MTWGESAGSVRVCLPSFLGRRHLHDGYRVERELAAAAAIINGSQ